MEKKVTAGSSISQNEENVKAFFSEKFSILEILPLYHKAMKKSRPLLKKIRRCA